LAAHAITGCQTAHTRQRTATTEDLRSESLRMFMNVATPAQSLKAIALIGQPPFFWYGRRWRAALVTRNQRKCTPAVGRQDLSGMRAVARKVGPTLRSDRLPAAPLSSENSRGPEVLRPRLTAGLPLSAIGREAAVRREELDRHRSHSLLGSPTSRGRHSPVRRVRSMVIRARGTSANLSQIGDSLDQMREYVRKTTRRDPASIDRRIGHSNRPSRPSRFAQPAL
jgi:hypothetical protein